MRLRKGASRNVIPPRHSWSEPLRAQRLPSAHSLKPPYLFLSLRQIAFPASYCAGATGSTDYLLNPVNPSSHQSGMILTIIVFAAASIKRKQGSGEMRWNETSGRISGENTLVCRLRMCVRGEQTGVQGSGKQSGPAHH